jgi:hypothetical protein
MLNTHETAARMRKAQAIADLLICGYETLDAATPLSVLAAHMTEHERISVAYSAGQRTPSDETWAMVVGLIAMHERHAARIAEAVA